MSAPNYVGDTDWKRQAGGSFGFTKDGLQFRELVFRGRIDFAKAFVAQFPKGTSCPMPGEGHLTLISAPVVRDENGVSGSATLRFEGISGVNNPDQGDETKQFFNETKEVVIQGSVDDETRARYSYISPQAVITYKDNKRRDLLPVNKRFRHPQIFGSTFNNKGSFYYDITKVQFLVEKAGQAAFSVEQILNENFDPTTEKNQHFNVKQISGFQSVTEDADGVFTHIEQHFLILEPVAEIKDNS